VQRIAQTLRPAARRVNVARYVEFNHFFIERIPEAVAERRRFVAAALPGVRVEEASDESLLLHASLEIRNNRFRTHARALTQSTHAAKNFGKKFDLPRDEIVRLLREPLDEFWILAVHHLVRTRRD